MNINIIITHLPKHVQAMTTPNDDGTYTIVVNDHLSQHRIVQALVHELTHIAGNDFSADEQATLLEEMVRCNTAGCDLGQFNFFYHYVSA